MGLISVWLLPCQEVDLRSAPEKSVPMLQSPVSLNGMWISQSFHPHRDPSRKHVRQSL